MVSLGTNDLQNTKNALIHALEYPATSRKIIRLLANHIVKKYGRATLHIIFEEIKHG